MHRTKIAIIDNGIDETFLKTPLEYKIFVTQDGQCLTDHCSMEAVTFMHGTTCAIMIEKYFPQCALSSVRVLEADGTGLLTKLGPALEWCRQHQINIINVSLGSVHFKDKKPLQALINQYAAKGLLIIAAASNKDVISYPASLSNVIGAAIDSKQYRSIAGHSYPGLDVLVPPALDPLITSNSYAAPYITALVARLYGEMAAPCLYAIKQALRAESLRHGIHMLPEYYEPDWIHTALVKANRINEIKSNADYYFNIIDNTATASMDQVDTVITDHTAMLHEEAVHNKHIVYLGNEQVPPPAAGRFFWSPHMKLEQILNTVNEGSLPELQIPIVLWEGTDFPDEMFLLSQLKKHFYADGYHLYAISFHAESVLYDLDYIPEEALLEKHQSALQHFIDWQIRYQQIDALLLSLPAGLLQRSMPLSDQADLQIICNRRKHGCQILFMDAGIITADILADVLDAASIQMIFEKTKEILTGDEDE